MVHQVLHNNTAKIFLNGRIKKKRYGTRLRRARTCFTKKTADFLNRSKKKNKTAELIMRLKNPWFSREKNKFSASISSDQTAELSDEESDLFKKIKKSSEWQPDLWRDTRTSNTTSKGSEGSELLSRAGGHRLGQTFEKKFGDANEIMGLLIRQRTGVFMYVHCTYILHAIILNLLTHLSTSSERANRLSVLSFHFL